MDYWQAADGTQSIDLSGDTGPGTFIEQVFPTLTGSPMLSFYYGNNADDPFASGSVRLIGSGTLLSQDLFHAGSTRQDMGYILFQQSFVADASSTILRFTHLDSPHPIVAAWLSTELRSHRFQSLALLRSSVWRVSAYCSRHSDGEVQRECVSDNAA